MANNTKRYKKTMGGLYGDKMNDRNIVYYTPSKIIETKSRPYVTKRMGLTNFGEIR